jgi:hypothetical protein
MWNKLNNLVYLYRTVDSIDFKTFDKEFKNIAIEYFIENEIISIFKRKNGEDFESLINIIAIYDYNGKYIKSLLPYLLENWHKEHESLAPSIQKFKIKEILEYLDEIVANPIEYLMDSETDWYGYIRRLFFTLGDINDEDCRNELIKFSTNKDETIVFLANEQLKRLGIL